MNRSQILLTLACATALTASAAGQINPQNFNSSRDATATGTSLSDQEAVGKANRASSLIGMDVRNTQNEKLGEIKDLVLDLHSGKVAYAVLSVGGFLGIGEKYIAIPAGAFTATPDESGLVLNADKAKIQNAPGFAKSSWPAVNDSTWQSQSVYWMPDQTAQGTIGATRSGTETGTSSYSSSAAAGQQTLRGQIVAVDAQAKTMSVRSGTDTHVFKFAERPTITLKDNRSSDLTDLKTGTTVAVGYHQENGSQIADSVRDLNSSETK
jgi:sporulation protein YlmC with PRC-barrel domain